MTWKTYQTSSSTRGCNMTINQFARRVAKREGLKKQVDIAQISEILRIVKAELLSAGINIYQVIKLMR